MSTIAITNSNWPVSNRLKLSIALAVWFAVVYVLGSMQVLATEPGQSLRPVLLTIVIPLALFLTTYYSVSSFRHFVLAQDLRFLTLLQSWRVVGFAFVLLYAHQVLPGLFAWPAGLGDVAVGLMAPWVVWQLAQDPEFAARRSFLSFHLLGMFDFVVAATTASLASGAYPSLHTGTPSSAPMEVWPLILFPGFFVPLFLFLHLAVLFQLRERSRVALTQ